MDTRLAFQSVKSTIVKSATLNFTLTLTQNVPFKKHKMAMEECVQG